MNIETSLQQLEQCVQQGGDAEAGLALLQKIKIQKITQPNTVTDKQYCLALEYGIFLSIANQDLDEFTKNYQILQTYYTSSASSMPPTDNSDERKYHILGLNLMMLLVQSNSSEFHSELELLLKVDKNILQNKYIAFPIFVERKLMVGIYDEILDNMQVPHPTYTFFMENLQETIRESVADNLEVSYESLTLKETAEILKFGSDSNGINELKQYITDFRDDWLLEDGDMIQFQPVVGTQQSQPQLSGMDIPNKQWIQQSLTYATEMERII